CSAASTIGCESACRTRSPRALRNPPGHEAGRRHSSMKRVAERLMLLAIAVGAASCQYASPFSCRQEPPDPKRPAPDSFRVAFAPSRGRLDVMARKAWAPIGVDRFYTLVQNKHFDDVRFFRVIQGFVAQFGMSGDPRVTEDWKRRCMADEPVKHTNSRGTMSF